MGNKDQTSDSITPLAVPFDPAKVIDALPFAVFTRDGSYAVTKANNAFRELFPHSDKTKHPCYKILFGEDRETPCSSCLMETAALHKKKSSREITITKDGKRLYLRMVAVPVLDGSGAVESVYKYIEDITARGLAEESISRYSKHLESLTENSTSSLKRNEQNLALISRAFHEINMAKDIHSLIAEIANSFIKFRAFPVFFAPFDSDSGYVSSISMHPATNSFPQYSHLSQISDAENPFNIAAFNRGFIIYHTKKEKEAFIRTAFSGGSNRFLEEMDKILSTKSILVLPISTETEVEAVVALCVSEQHLMEHFETYRHLSKYSAMSLAKQISALREQQAQKMAIMSLVKLMEYRDIETGLHLERLMKYTEILVHELAHDTHFSYHITSHYISDLMTSCMLHDIGKVGIPDHILKKPTKLSPDEFEIMKQHTLFGGHSLLEAERKVQGKSFLNMSREIALYHHEWWDGSGYPYGLRGDEIPLSARIIAIADVYDALRSKRPYKEPFTHDVACSIIENETGTHFDERISKAFFRCENVFDTLCAHGENHF
jgi:HD-GYP domain-containing protein (c-di-GMP phosphodiesterase class II)